MLSTSGLDIGEVDLIVNYDVVRSAIRSIQRIGRTGRKRDGRVVVLVSEGQEKKSYDSSKHSVGTLARALKSNKFKVNLGEPLFPTKPVVREYKMAVAGSFRSSQVEGHEGAKKRGRDTSSLDDRTESTVSSEWKLSASQKEYLSKITPAFTMPECSTCERMTRDLSRRFLTGRRFSLAKRNNRITARGRTSLILHKMERSHSCTDELGGHTNRSLPSKIPADFKFKSFPLKQLLDTEAHVDFHKPLDTVQEPVFATADCIGSERGEDSPSIGNCTKRTKLVASNPYKGAPGTKSSSVSNLQTTSLLDPGFKRDSSKAAASQRQSKTNPYAGLPKAKLQDASSTLNATDYNMMPTTCDSNRSHSNVQVANICFVDKSDPVENSTSVNTTRTNTNVDQYCSEGSSLDKLTIDGVACGSTSPQRRGQTIAEAKSWEMASVTNPVQKGENACALLQTMVESHATQRDPKATTEVAKVQLEGQGAVAGIAELDDEFILPSQSECSSSSDDGDNGDENTASMKIPITSAEVPEFCLPSPASSCSNSSTEETAETRKRSGNTSAQKSLFYGQALQSEELAITDDYLQTSNTPDGKGVFSRGHLYGKRRAIVDATQCANDASPSSDGGGDNGDNITNPTKTAVLSTDVPEFCLPSPASSCSDSSTDETVETRKRSGNTSAQKSLFCGAVNSFQSSDTPNEEVFFKRGNKYGKRRAIVDATQCADDLVVRIHPHESLQDTPPMRDLTNTQDPRTPSRESPTDEIVCAICFSGDSADEDPIVLCDGYGQDKVCNVAVHTTCYSIPETFRDDEEWRCDPCAFRHEGLVKRLIKCLSCGSSEGALKRVDGNIFNHIQCTVNEPPSTSHISKSREGPGKKLDSLRQKKMDQKRAVRKFFDEEAGIDSDEDMDGDLSEDEDVEAIEDEEANISGFINDTSQLGYTQDELDQFDLDANVTTIHQELDNMRTRANQFKTPILNRRMRDAKGRESLGSADSAKGLGNMHFIRSVLEHHRQGGDANDIEEHYHQMEAEASPPDENVSHNVEAISKQIIYYESSEDED